MKRIFLIIVIVFAGCSFIDPAAYKRSSIAFKKGGGLSVWDSDLTAAVENRRGYVCMQKALTAKAISNKAEVKISDAVLKIAQGIPSTASAQELINFQNSMSQTLAMLTTTTERTAFLESGLFYICQLSINNALTNEQVFYLTKKLIEDSANIDPKTGNLSHISSPNISDGKSPAQ